MDRNEERISGIFLSYREMNQAFAQVMTLVAQRHKITPIQLIVLRMLKENPQFGLTDLAEKMFLSTSTCSGIVDRMVKAWLVTRTRKGEDRRAVSLELTDKGQRLWAETDVTRFEMLRPLLELPEKDQEELIRIQQQILRILRKVREDVQHG